MKTKPFLVSVLTLAGSCLIAQAAANDHVSKAVKKLADTGNYSWKATSESSQWNPGPTIGKTQKNGPTLVRRTFGDNTFQSVHHGEKAATQTQDGWRSLSELEANTDDNRSRFAAMMLRNFEAPAAEALRLLKNIPDLSLADGVYAGKLSEDGVKSMLTFRRGGTGGPEVRDSSGSVRFWVKDGVLAKYQYTVKGTMTWNNNDMEIDRTTTVEISDIGSTKIELPEAAKEKLS